VKLKGDQKFLDSTEHPAMAQYPERIPRNQYGKSGGSSFLPMHRNGSLP
jgi:hypothetical protein